MATIHFLNVLDGDCTIIQHDNQHDKKRTTVIDVSNAYNATDTDEEKATKEEKEKVVKKTNFVPDGKINYFQKEYPDNPIDYLNKLKIDNIFRFIITHPDMDHLDGICDLYTDFPPTNTWDTDNIKDLDLKTFPKKYNPEDWKFYKSIRDGKYTNTKRHTYTAGDSNLYFNEDYIKILCPTPTLIKQANKDGGDINDLSFVLLFKPPKKNGGHWKIVFPGDSHDNSWKYILDNYKEDVTNIDVLFAPHHGRDSNRSYEFLKTLNPRVTLFGNASSDHLAYTSYPDIRITNNQAGYVVIDSNEDRLLFLVKNKKFADNFRNNEKRKWGEASYDKQFDAYALFQLT